MQIFLASFLKRVSTISSSFSTILRKLRALGLSHLESMTKDPTLWSEALAAYMKDANTTAGTRLVSIPICPDLLDYECIGAADNLRGRVVRAFFWVMRIWPS